jgi:hypothetical protein
MINSRIKDRVNGLLAIGYNEITRLIGEYQYPKAQSLARAFGIFAPRGEDSNYDWKSVLLPLQRHYGDYPVVDNDVDFIRAFEALQ